MKLQAKMNRGALSLFALAFSVSALAADPVQELCGDEFGMPKVTVMTDDTLLICSSAPAAYMTLKQAEAIALQDNAKQADLECQSRFKLIGPPKVFARRYAVTVISRFACQ